MARIPRLTNSGEPTVYHVMSRTALDGLPMGDVENDYLLKLIKKLSKLYFVEILGFALMGNHFHLLTRVYPTEFLSNDQLKKRYETYYNGEQKLRDGQIPLIREKLSSLSGFMKEIKQGFTRFYNKEHERKGFFWGGRFKSVIVEQGETLINCLAYIDLNPVRAGIVENPEDYRWNTLGYIAQTGNKEDFISYNFGIEGHEKASVKEKLRYYREFMYELGYLPTNKGKSIKKEIIKKERTKNFETTRIDNFKNRTRYFTDSGIIGSKAYVTNNYQKLKSFFNSKHEKIPRTIKGLDGIFSLKKLSSV
jgi:putative transposase